MAEPHAETTATVEHAGPAAEHAAPAAFGLITAPMFIALAMIVVILFMIAKKVPAAIGKALDSKIEVIRNQLAEAETLRKDAEALKAEYEAKTKSADKEAATIVERAKHEADVERQRRMEETRRQIDAETTRAIGQIRSEVADLTVEATERVVGKVLDSADQRRLVEEAVQGLDFSALEDRRS